MTPTKDDIPAMKWGRFHTTVKAEGGYVVERGLSVLLSGDSGRRFLANLLSEEMAKPGYVQTCVMVDDIIAAVEVHGKLLWLDKVPPRKYWLNYRARPTGRPSNIAPCGLPIPARYLESESATVNPS